ncbi:MAG: IS630 family transposase [Firmicutes bacterium]|nr:IS630 family transposase [Bacillota bacterium]
MPKKKYHVCLSQDERKALLDLISKGSTTAKSIMHANVLLVADENSSSGRKSESEIAELYHVNKQTVHTIRKVYSEKGLEAAVGRKKRETPPVQPKITGEVEAKIIAISCSTPPAGRSKWSLRLLADKAVELQYIDSISHEAVGRLLKKNELKPHLRKCWCIPPKQNAAFVAGMEDILDLYQQPFDESSPVICMDEKPYQLLDETRPPIPMEPGNPERRDGEYIRNGTCSIFIFTEPLAGWRHVAVCERRTRIDWAHQIQELLEVYYPETPMIRLVMDNLNTHSNASLYEAFPAETARSLAKRLEIHYTPKHGSWLNIAEIELSAMTRQCLDRRIASIETLRLELAQWQIARNNHQKGVDWQFTTDTARIKLKRLYPQFKS